MRVFIYHRCCVLLGNIKAPILLLCPILIQQDSKLQQYKIMKPSWIKTGLSVYLKQLVLKGISMHIACLGTVKNTAVMQLI